MAQQIIINKSFISLNTPLKHLLQHYGLHANNKTLKIFILLLTHHHTGIHCLKLSKKIIFT